MITVWRVPLDAPELARPDRHETLSAEEHARAARFRDATLRVRWLAARVALRALLGQHAGLAPHALTFAVSETGKPRLEGEAHPHFSLSHSGATALVAISESHAVGVDVEEVRPMPDLDTIVERFFAPEERAAIHSLTAARRLAAFHRCWTRKEAFVKATGAGIGYPLATFAVSVGAEDARFVRVDGTDGPASAWTLRHLALGREVRGVADDLRVGEPVGALAVRAPNVQVEERLWGA